MKELAPLLGCILAGLYRHEGKKSRITATFAGLGCQGWLKHVQPARTPALSLKGAGSWMPFILFTAV
jgi:hypothetical protein